MILKRLSKHKLLVFSVLSYLILFMINGEVGMVALKNTAYYFKEMIEILPVVFIIISIIEAWIPKEVIIRGLGNESGFRGIGLSFALGSLSAGPLYAAFPLSKLLLNKGASIENIVIIISAWAVIKIPMLVNEVKFIGFDFMVVRWILSVVSIIIMSKVMTIQVKSKDIKRDPVEIESDSVWVGNDYCIGCGVCESALPEYFKIIDGKATLINSSINKEDKIKISRMAEKCPVGAIKIKSLNTSKS